MIYNIIRFTVIILEKTQKRIEKIRKYRRNKMDNIFDENLTPENLEKK